MSTTEKNLTLLFLLQDILSRQIAKNRMGVYRLMERQHDPFPRPILLSEGKQQRVEDKDGKTRHRVSGRRVAWIADEVESWIARRAAERNAADIEKFLQRNTTGAA